MVLIERYLHEVGKHLPRKNREDILAEIRSHLEDTLDERAGGKPTEADVITLLKETGSPQNLAASYSGQGQYLVGPALYPLWRMVTGIVIAAVLGSQLLALGSFGLGGKRFRQHTRDDIRIVEQRSHDYWLGGDCLYDPAG